MGDSPRRDIFLDFLSPDNNVLYGTYENFARQPQRHVQLLEEGINVAVLLCGEKCLLPPFFPLQCEMARSALTTKADYIASGYIQFPVRSRLEKAAHNDHLASQWRE